MSSLALIDPVLAGPEVPYPAPPRSEMPIAPPRRRRGWLGLISPWLGLLVGVPLTVLAYSLAAHNQGGRWPDVISVAGLVAVFVPAGVRLLGRPAAATERLGLVVALGLFSFLPKYLRDPSGPVYFDEIGHWHQVGAMSSSHTLFVPNPMIPIIQFFPGLHALAASLGALAGDFTWPMAEALLAVLHVLTLLGIWAIAQGIWRSPRVSGAAALLYAINPGFMFFDAQFSYESFALVLAIWTVAATIRLQAEEGRGGRWAWLSLALVLGGACVITHHISSLAIVAMLAGMSIAAWIRRGPRHRTVALLTTALTLTLTGLVAAWWLVIASGTIRYLSPTVSGGFHQLLGLMGHEQQSRQAFSQSTAPLYERGAALLAPLIVAVFAVRGLWHLRRVRPFVIGGEGLLAFGLLYFASLPLVLSQSASEGAHRSWTFSWIALSVLISQPVIRLVTRGPGRSRKRLGFAAGGLVVAAIAVIVGNLTLGIDQQYRFPGPYSVGSDSRALTGETLNAAAWLRRTQGPGHVLAADRSTALAFYATGGERPAVAYSRLPLWKLYSSPSTPSAGFLARLGKAGVQYLVVDRRLASAVPRVGFYFDPGEPQAYHRRHPVSLAALTKFDWLPWASAIYRSGHIVIYRLDLASSMGESPSVAPSQLEPRGRS